MKIRFHYFRVDIVRSRIYGRSDISVNNRNVEKFANNELDLNMTFRKNNAKFVSNDPFVCSFYSVFKELNRK